MVSQDITRCWSKRKIDTKPLTSPWGTFEYLRMPFGLLNVGATFQRAMDYAFNELIGKTIEIYQDDLTVFSKERSDHVAHLRKVFERCRKFGISLNLAKSTLGVDKGKLLGHIISKDGVKIDPESRSYKESFLTP